MIVAIVQARMGSTRLPGKVMMEISGKPMLWHVVDRARQAKRINQVVVATTTNPEDEKIIKLALEMGVKGYAGSQDDVLDRYYQTAKINRADIIVRVTGDCPLIDPKIIDKTIEFFLENNFDYVSTAHISKGELKSTYPDGLDTEVFSFKALEKAWKEAKLFSEREHVTPYIWKNQETFRCQSLQNDRNLSHLRWTVDKKCDLKFVREVYKRLYKEGEIFLMNDVIALLEKEPQLVKINRQVMRDEGYSKSLEKDKENKNISVSCRGIKIPLYNRIVNFGLFSFENTSNLIDKLNPENREWEKVKVLVQDYNYLNFLKRITEVKEKDIVGYLNDFYKDDKFKKQFSEKLRILERTKGDWGDVRFHSLSLYVVVRARKPKIIIETGVASGKSTAIILLALEHNKKGRLISIDLPNPKGKVLEDGAKTSTYKYKTGWLVPQYLRKRWNLKIGDSVKVLPKVIKNLKKIDIFFHDSLHTYSHVKKE